MAPDSDDSSEHAGALGSVSGVGTEFVERVAAIQSVSGPRRCYDGEFVKVRFEKPNDASKVIDFVLDSPSWQRLDVCSGSSGSARQPSAAVNAGPTLINEGGFLTLTRGVRSFDNALTEEEAAAWPAQWASNNGASEPPFRNKSLIDAISFDLSTGSQVWPAAFLTEPGVQNLEKHCRVGLPRMLVRTGGGSTDVLLDDSDGVRHCMQAVRAVNEGDQPFYRFLVVQKGFLVFYEPRTSSFTSKPPAAVDFESLARRAANASVVHAETPFDTTRRDQSALFPWSDFAAQFKDTPLGRRIAALASR